MKCRYLLLLLAEALFWNICAVSATIDSTQARQIAVDFVCSHLQHSSGGQRRLAARKFEQASIASTRRAYLLRVGSEFVLIARDSSTCPVLGYNLNSCGQVANLQSSSASSRKPLPLALQALLSASGSHATPYPPEGTKHFSPVLPLLTTVRQQGSPYNALCPIYHHADGTPYTDRCLVGCVATAMEQIITYHRPFLTLLDTLHGWTAERFSVADELPGQTLDTHLIRNNYDTEPYSPQEADAVARLSYWLGLACHMQWGPSSSGAYSKNLVEPLRKAFGFPYVHYLEARLYDPSAYWNFLAQEIMAQRPVYYAGAIMGTGGHAFVLDGLDEDGFFHVNWGYGGDFDGYFRLDVLSYAQPEADRKAGIMVEDGFLADQEAIVVSTSPVAPLLLPDTLTRTATDVVVKHMEVLQTPVTNNFTTVRMQVWNPSPTQALNNTFGLLENVPTDTSIIVQAKWLALTACQLAPNESKTLDVHVKFTRTGRVTLSVTHDGSHLLSQMPLEVSAASSPTFQTASPSITFTDGPGISVCQPISNTSTTQRASQTFVYDLLCEDTGESCRTTHYIYLDAKADTLDQVSFTQLTPGQTYTLRLRERWPIVQSTSFVMPASSGIVPPQVKPSAQAGQPTEWFSLDGRRIPANHPAPGVYLLRKGDQTIKTIIKH